MVWFLRTGGGADEAHLAAARPGIDEIANATEWHGRLSPINTKTRRDGGELWQWTAHCRGNGAWEGLGEYERWAAYREDTVYHGFRLYLGGCCRVRVLAPGVTKRTFPREIAYSTRPAAGHSASVSCSTFPRGPLVTNFR